MYGEDCGNDGDSIGELLCMGMTRPTFPNVLKLLQDPCVWIGDTGATRHMTRHNIGPTNQQKPNGSRATMGNGHVEKASVVGDIFGTVCDKHGEQLGPVSMADVAVIPKLAYNMFSMTKMMRQGWKLGSNKEAMWLSKGKNKLVFVLSSAGQDNLEPYEYACEVPHILFKFKSLSST